jgi:hypothetical protein
VNLTLVFPQGRLRVKDGFRAFLAVAREGVMCAQDVPRAPCGIASDILPSALTIRTHKQGLGMLPSHVRSPGVTHHLCPAYHTSYHVTRLGLPDWCPQQLCVFVAGKRNSRRWTVILKDDQGRVIRRRPRIVKAMIHVGFSVFLVVLLVKGVVNLW